MQILILNPILFTPNNGIIPKVKSIKDTIIYNMCLGFIQLGHHVTFAAAEDCKSIEEDLVLPLFMNKINSIVPLSE